MLLSADFNFRENLGYSYPRGCVLKRNKLEQKPTAWTDWPLRRMTPTAPLIGSNTNPLSQLQTHMDTHGNNYWRLCDYYRNGGKRQIHTWAHILRHGWLLQDSLWMFMPSLPAVEQQADKVTFSSWGGMIAQPQHATERDRDGGIGGKILNHGVERWKKFGELWLRKTTWNDKLNLRMRRLD